MIGIPSPMATLAPSNWLHRAAWLSAALVCGALILVLSLVPAVAQVEGRRVALVVGNSDYQSVTPLVNAAKDARDVAAALNRLDIEVTLIEDATLSAFHQQLEEFVDTAEGADSVLFYFSGHGFQLDGVNFLAPVDAQLSSREAIEEESMRLDHVIARLQARNRQTVVLLDACRNNPLPESMQGGQRDGLAQPETGSGTFIAFATQPNNITFDGSGDNSPFTNALLSHLETPGISVSEMMIRVRNEVSRQTLGRQIPWDQSSLSAQFYFNPVYETASGLTEADYNLLAGLSPERRSQFLRLLVNSGVDLDIEVVELELAALDAAQAPTAEEEQPAQPRREFSLVTVDPGVELADDAPATEPATEELAALPELPESPDTEAEPAARPEETATPQAEEDTELALTSEPEAEAEITTVAGAEPEIDRSPDPEPEREATETTELAALSDPASAQPGELTRSFPSSQETALPDELVAPFAASEVDDTLVLAALGPTDTLIPIERSLPRIIGEDATEAEEEVELPENITVAVQEELARLGCYRARVDGLWGPMSARALMRYFAETDSQPPEALDPSAAIWNELRVVENVVCEITEPVVASRPAASSSSTRASGQQTQQRTQQQAAEPAPQINRSRLTTGAFR